MGSGFFAQYIFSVKIYCWQFCTKTKATSCGCRDLTIFLEGYRHEEYNHILTLYTTPTIKLEFVFQ